MDATNGGDERRVRRWLDSERGFVARPTSTAWELLSRRLHARRTAGLVSVPLVLLAVVSYGASFAGYRHDPSANHWRHIGLLSLGMAFLVLALITWQELAHRGDRRIAATLQQRVGRGAHRGVLPILGRRAALVAAVALVGQGGLALVLLATGAGWLGWTYLAGYLVTTAVTWLRLRRVSAQPALAVDPSSLLIDHRLRTWDALQAGLPLCALTGFFISAIESDTATRHFFLQALACVIVYLNVSAIIWARSQRWPRSATPFAGWDPLLTPPHPTGPVPS
jgi:hypothetical protein